MAVVEITEQSIDAYVTHLQMLLRKRKTVYVDEISKEELLSEEKNPIVYQASDVNELCTYLDAIR